METDRQSSDRANIETHQQLEVMNQERTQAHIQTQTQLARLDERLKSLESTQREGFKDIKENLLSRVNELTTTKLAANDFNTYRSEQAEKWSNQNAINVDKEVRMRFLERYVWIGIALVGVVEPVAIALFIKYAVK